MIDFDAIVFVTGGVVLIYIVHLWRRHRRNRNR